MPDEKKTSGSRHIITVERRERATVTGVIDVISFDEETIIAETEMGILILRGHNLHVNRLNLDNGELDVDGEIMNITYEDQAGAGKTKGILNKLFR